MVDDELEHYTAAEQMFAEAGGGGFEGSLSRIAMSGRPRKVRSPITTHGVVGTASGRAWVYVATRADGAVKVGMTSDPEARACDLRSVMRLKLEVTQEAARKIETEALRALGRKKGETEWAPVPLSDALAAVWRARDMAGRSMRVDPSLTDEDARLLRLGLAGQGFRL